MINNIKNKIIIAILAAMFIPLSYFSFNLPIANIKFTLQNLPIFIAGIMYGPLAGVVVGGIGQSVSQILQYGLDIMIIPWILPQIILGFLTGIFVYKLKLKFNTKRFIITIIILNLTVTILNTLMSYFDALIKEYNIYATTISIIPRFIASLALGIVYSLLIPYIITAIKKLG